MSKILLQQFCGGLSRSRSRRVDAWVLRIGVNKYQPVRPQKVDGMIHLHSAPRLLGQHPGMVGRLGRLGLVFCAGSTPVAEIHNGCIYSWPVDCSACQLLHPLHPEVSQVKKLQYLGPQAVRNDQSGAVQKAPVSCGQW